MIKILTDDVRKLQDLARGIFYLMRWLHKPAFVDHFGGRKSEDFVENPLPRISMFTSSRVWSDFGRISQQIRGFQIDYECGLCTVLY
jgi:hypothetical protein